MKNIKQEKGITLIALVITIIVLLILAGVAISMLSGENGILTKASEAKEKTEEAQKEEEIGLASMELETYFITNNLKYKCAYGYVTGIDVGEEVSQLQSILQADGYELKAIDGTDNFTAKNGKDEYMVTTGMVIEKSGQEVARTVIFGDTNCDGWITSDDSLKITGEKLIEDYEILSADVNHNAIINYSSPILDAKISELNQKLEETEDMEEYTELEKQIEELKKENENDATLIISGSVGNFEIVQNVYVGNIKNIECKTTKNVREKYVENISEKFFSAGYKIEEYSSEMYIIKGVTRGKTTVGEIKSLLPDNTIIKYSQKVLSDEDIINEDEGKKTYQVYTGDSYMGEIRIAKIE